MPMATFLIWPFSLKPWVAHEHGITHRSQAPQHHGRRGVVKILDFGLAVTKGLPPGTPPEDAPTEETVLAGRMAGTLAYMAPEQLAGAPPDSRSDIFSLGVVLYQMAGGRLPFRGGSAAEIVANILRSEPPRLAELNEDVPSHLSRVVHTCLEKNPARRVASARALCEELRAIRRSRDATASEVTRSIAVLPFLDMSPEQDQGYFCEGIAEEILIALSRIEGLRVVSRTSSFRFKAALMDVREIGDRLGVASLLEGGVRKAGDRVRITVNLVDVKSGIELWTEKYDRQLRDIFAIQDEISTSVVQALKGALSPRERRVMKHVATSDVRAYDYYLRGRSYFTIPAPGHAVRPADVRGRSRSIRSMRCLRRIADCSSSCT
jgi:TolB-like protein